MLLRVRVSLRDKTVEFDLDEILEYLKESGASSIGDFWLFMEDLRRIGEILWYRDYEKGKIVALKVFDSPSVSNFYLLFIY
jgi:hypothetical protein